MGWVFWVLGIRSYSSTSVASPDQSHCAETVAPDYHADHAYQPFSLKPFLKRLVIKLFLKKFVFITPDRVRG
ncbi:MAG: hypothetical protein ACOX7X_11830 [Methanosarcina flavescens]|uniref:Uncharacterized protein n=1 Tax=Methanosarcina flavescens TaxID=1715806 RepID=A0A7K4AT87_9EURY|nr:hypothetical protein [Methanosarcina flavescens]NLK31780.1 hypothetical protein [Methanosarcina flavescens]